MHETDLDRLARFFLGRLECPMFHRVLRCGRQDRVPARDMYAFDFSVRAYLSRQFDDAGESELYRNVGNDGLNSLYYFSHRGFLRTDSRRGRNHA